MSKKNPTRAERFSEAQALISDAKGRIEELKEELENWLGNMPQNLQDGSKAGELGDAIQALDDCISQLDEAENAEVNFPGMR